MLLEIEDLIEEMYDIFPDIEEKSIEDIVKFYFKAMAKEMKKGECITIFPSNLPNGESIDNIIRFRRSLKDVDNIAILREKHKNKHEEKTD